jgi:hypothetical protein
MHATAFAFWRIRRRAGILLALLAALLAAVMTERSRAQDSSEPTQCRNTQPSILVLGQRGRVARTGDPAPLRIRAGPDTTHDELTTIPVGGLFYVFAGPECSPLYAWYRVEYRDLLGDEPEVIEGWIAEGDAANYFVEPYPPAG